MYVMYTFSLNLSRTTDGLGLLGLVIAVFRLELLNLGDILLLGLLGGETVVDSLLPGVVLGLALFLCVRGFC